MPGQKVIAAKFNEETFEPDDTDVRIAEYYSEKAHTPFLVAAREMGLTYDVVRYRVRRMKEVGFFIESRPVVNYAALGYQVYSVFLRYQPSEPKDLMGHEGPGEMELPCIYNSRTRHGPAFFSRRVKKRIRDVRETGTVPGIRRTEIQLPPAGIA